MRVGIAQANALSRLPLESEQLLLAVNSYEEGRLRVAPQDRKESWRGTMTVLIPVLITELGELIARFRGVSRGPS